MAGKTITMSKVKQVIRMYNLGVPKKEIARRLGISRNTVKEYINRIEDQNLSPPELLEKESPELESLFISSIYQDKQYQRLASKFSYMENELSRTGVTRQLLWYEYKAKDPEGYSYSRFCYHFSQWLKSSNACMHLEHKPGDKTYIDFAGKKLSYVDRDTGEVVPSEVLVTCLGYSQKIYVQACRNQKKENFISACADAFSFYGGTTRAIVPDNLKSAIEEASKYEPILNESFREFADHYGMVVYPARSRKPKDKAIVEKAVSIVYNRIYAVLRDRVFYSLEELNQAILDLVDGINETNFQGKPFSRNDLFEKEEKCSLSPLPRENFEIRQNVRVTVMKNSHVLLSQDKHYYSVPFRYISKRVHLVYGHRTISIYSDGQRIAFHQRDPRPYKYTTDPDHLPSTHRFVSEWSPEKFLSWAASVDQDVETYIRGVLDKKPYPEIAYRSCIGILSLAKKKGKDRLINACRRGLYYQSFGYNIIKNILKKELDKEPWEEPVQQTLPLHINIRGADYYK